MKNSDPVYIYGIADPQSKEIKYIGRSRDPRQRYFCHLSRSPNTLLYLWIRKLRKLESRPILIIKEITDFNNGKERELYWINHYGINNLFNIRFGGGPYMLANR